MSENYFKVFDASQTNMQSQTSYETESVVADGYSSGLVKSETMNKILHQSSIMVAAIAGLIEDAGLDALDTDLSALKTGVKTIMSGQKVYYSFESVQSGATQDTALNTILGAMAVNSTLCVAVTAANTYYPAAGYIAIRKFSSTSAMGELITTSGASYELYVADITSSVVASNWLGTIGMQGQAGGSTSTQINFDDYKTPGVYYVDWEQYSESGNFPMQWRDFNLMVFSGVGGNVTQMCISLQTETTNKSEIFTRSYLSWVGGWTPWSKFVNTDWVASIANGGTGATDAKTAIKNLGGIGNQDVSSDHDFNNYTANGVYMFFWDALQDSSNAPYTGASGMLTVMNTEQNTIIQKHIAFNGDNNIYVRGYFFGEWSSWLQVETSKNLATDVQNLLTGGSVSVVKNIQRGDANYSVGAKEVYVLQLGSAVNVAKTMVIWENSNPSTEYGSHPPYFTSYTSTGVHTETDVPEIKTGTTQYIAFPRSGTSSAAYGSWQLVEFY